MSTSSENIVFRVQAVFSKVAVAQKLYEKYYTEMFCKWGVWDFVVDYYDQIVQDSTVAKTMPNDSPNKMIKKCEAKSELLKFQKRFRHWCQNSAQNILSRIRKRIFQIRMFISSGSPFLSVFQYFVRFWKVSRTYEIITTKNWSFLNFRQNINWWMRPEGAWRRINHSKFLVSSRGRLRSAGRTRFKKGKLWASRK